MNKELDEIRKVLKDYEEEIKIVNLYKKYINIMKSGLEFTGKEIENLDIYINVSDAYRSGKIDKIEELIENRKKEYMDMIKESFEKIEDKTSSNFVDKCIKNIDEGKIGQVKIMLRQSENKIESKQYKER